MGTFREVVRELQRSHRGCLVRLAWSPFAYRTVDFIPSGISDAPALFREGKCGVTHGNLSAELYRIFSYQVFCHFEGEGGGLVKHPVALLHLIACWRHLTFFVPWTNFVRCFAKCNNVVQAHDIRFWIAEQNKTTSHCENCGYLYRNPRNSAFLTSRRIDRLKKTWGWGRKAGRREDHNVYSRISRFCWWVVTMLASVGVVGCLLSLL